MQCCRKGCKCKKCGRGPMEFQEEAIQEGGVYDPSILVLCLMF